MEELNVGGLGLCVGVAGVKVALVQVLSSVGRDGSNGGEEGKDDGLGEKHVDSGWDDWPVDGSIGGLLKKLEVFDRLGSGVREAEKAVQRAGFG